MHRLESERVGENETNVLLHSGDFGRRKCLVTSHPENANQFPVAVTTGG